jgi:hypothetical protein
VRHFRRAGRGVVVFGRASPDDAQRMLVLKRCREALGAEAAQRRAIAIGP